MRTAPVVLFVYNRPDHTRRTLEALSANVLADRTLLIVYADGPKAGASETDRGLIEQTRRVVRSRQWMAGLELIEADQNKGLARSVIDGVTETIEKYGRVIVLEDDLVTATGFLSYMNAALDRYQDEEKVAQISGYQFPVRMAGGGNFSFFLPFTTSWGWATWKRAWDHFDEKATGYQRLKTDAELAHRFDLDGAFPYTPMLIQQMEGTGIDSWAIRWWWSVFQQDGVSLFPGSSLINNIGFGAGATHTSDSHHALAELLPGQGQPILSFPERTATDERQYQIVKDFLAGHFKPGKKKSRWRDLLSRVKGGLFAPPKENGI